MKLSEMRQALDAEGIRLTRSLGQNFLHDAHQLQRIVDQGRLRPGDRVVEIGPGLGPLTERLLATGARVLALEKDARLLAVLRRRLAGADRLELREADALDWLRTGPSLDDCVVVSNLPYSVASPMLVEMASLRRRPRRLVLTLQLEVVQRLGAGPGTRDYGVLTLLVALRYEVESWFKIPAGCFFPAPDVDSACVSLVARPEPLLPPGRARVFERVVKRGFSQRRKMMFKLQLQDWPKPVLEAAYVGAGLRPDVRAEAVSLETFVVLTRLLAETGEDASVGEEGLHE